MSTYAAYRRTEAALIVAIDKWSHILGYPGGSPECGACRCATQWGWCPRCQPVEFGRLP